MDATTFFLTYPQTSLTHDELYNALLNVKPIVWARVAIEQHEDGQPHLHAVIRFGARVKTRSDMHVFDVATRHPNIQVPRRLKDVLEYCGKDGNYKDYGPVPTSKCVYEELITHAKSGERDSFDKCALEGRISFMWAEHLWKRHSNALRDIHEPGQGTECLQLQGLQFTGKSTLVVGQSGCGKSTWAKRVCPKPALWVRSEEHTSELQSTQ